MKKKKQIKKHKKKEKKLKRLRDNSKKLGREVKKKLEFVSFKLLLKRNEKRLKLLRLRNLDWSKKQLSLRDKELKQLKLRDRDLKLKQKPKESASLKKKLLTKKLKDLD